jgi:hypothetical protein
VLRRTRGASQYAAFEYLAYRAGLRFARRTTGVRGRTRTRLPDPWLAVDRDADDVENRA